MNTIFIHELKVETHVGIYEWERLLPQTVRLDLDMEAPSQRPFITGEFADALDYAAVVARIVAFARDNPHPLLERFTEAIAQLVISEFGVPFVRVRVAKLAPLPGVKELGILIERRAP